MLIPLRVKVRNPNLGGLALVRHVGPVTALSISGDSRWLATASDDGTVRIWDLYTDSDKTAAWVQLLTDENLLSHAERAVGRNFTREEWDELFPGENYR